MARYAWVLEVRPGYEEDCKRCHDEIWPEMLGALKEAGIQLKVIQSEEPKAALDRASHLLAGEVAGTEVSIGLGGEHVALRQAPNLP